MDYPELMSEGGTDELASNTGATWKAWGIQLDKKGEYIQNKFELVLNEGARLDYSISCRDGRDLTAVDQQDTPIHVCPSLASQVDEGTSDVLPGSCALGRKEGAREDTLFSKLLVSRDLEGHESWCRHIRRKD